MFGTHCDRSGVVRMKNKLMAIHHLIAFTNFCVNDKEVQMSTVDMTQKG
jgi:hypothetical protein